MNQDQKPQARAIAIPRETNTAAIAAASVLMAAAAVFAVQQGPTHASNTSVPAAGVLEPHR